MHAKTGYKRIGLPHQILIKKLRALGQNQAQTALAIGCHKPSIGNNLKLCKKEGYSALEAIRISVIIQTEEAKSVKLSVSKRWEN